VYDYVDGKADWMAYGLAVEGEDGPFLGDQVVDVATCDVQATVADARAALDASQAPSVVLVHAGGLALGEVDADALDGHADDVALLDVLRPVPTTVRPSVTVAALAHDGGGSRLVTTSDGRVLGRATVEGDRFETELAEVVDAVHEHFGDREPSAAELRQFLRDRLVAEGRSEQDAEAFLDQLDTDGPE
jgi:hypothetical protein